MNIIIAGDFCPNARLANNNPELFKSISKDVLDCIKSADYSIVNFECPIYPDKKKVKIKKQGPNLGCSDSALRYIKEIGFSGITLANNHIKDYGCGGITATENIANILGLDYVGVGDNITNASRILYKKIGNMTVAFINCCENEFSIATSTSAGANAINPISLYYEIQEARNNSDFVIVIVHGGIEHFQLPTHRMKQTYRFFVDVGADAVITHHQHCYSGYEVYHNKPIFYGIGNFLFDWDGNRNDIWNEGYMVNLSFSIEGVSFKIIPYIQCNESLKVELMDEENYEKFESHISELSSIILDDKMLDQHLDSYMNQRSFDYELALSPYSSRYPVALFRRGWLPSFLDEKRILRLYNYLKCESHRERLIHFIENKYKLL